MHELVFNHANPASDRPLDIKTLRHQKEKARTQVLSIIDRVGRVWENRVVVLSRCCCMGNDGNAGWTRPEDELHLKTVKLLEDTAIVLRWCTSHEISLQVAWFGSVTGLPLNGGACCTMLHCPKPPRLTPKNTGPPGFEQDARTTALCLLQQEPTCSLLQAQLQAGACIL